MVEKIPFTEDLKLGVESIDTQHEKLIGLINVLIDMGETTCNRETVGAALDALSDYIFEHFQDEEKIMRKVHYEHFAEHRAQHTTFVKKTIEFQKKYREEDFNLGIDILLFLSKWFIEHIKGEDPKYVEMVKAHGY